MHRPTTLRRTTAASALAAASLLAVAACGSASTGGGGSTTKLAPADAVRTGYQGLQNANALTYTLKLDITQAQIDALQKLAASKGDDSTDDSDTAVAEKIIRGGTVVIAQKAAGKSFAADQADSASLGKESFGLTVNAGDQQNLVQLVVLDKVLYGRADVSKIASYSGTSGEDALKEFSSGEVATKYPFVAKAAAGDWIKYDVADGLKFLQGVAPSKVPSVDPSQVNGLRTTIGKVFADDITATRAGEDSSLGDHLVLKGNSKTVGTDLVSGLKSSLGTLPGASDLFDKADTSSLPSKDVTVDAYVKNGALDALKLNITQFLDADQSAAINGSAITVELDIARSASISAPSDSTTVTTAQIIGLFTAASESSGDSSFGTSSASPDPSSSAGF